MVRAESTNALPDLSDEFESITRHAALVDRSNVGRLRVSGEDTVDLLNRLSTNNLEHFTHEKGMGTVLTTNKGRIIDLLFAIPMGGDVMLLTSPGLQQKVADWIEFYTFIEDVNVQNITDETAMLAIVGPESAEAIRRALGGDADRLELYAPVTVDALDGVSLVRTDHFSLPTFELTGNQQAVERAKALFGQHGVKPVSDTTAENLRIAMGVPAATGELTEDFNPLEAGLRPHISFNKICYIGQEVVSRLNAYEKVQKHLVTLAWENKNGVPVPGTPLTVAGKDIGVLTSVGVPNDGAPGLALGYVRKIHVESGTSVVAESAGGAVTLTVTGLSGEG